MLESVNTHILTDTPASAQTPTAALTQNTPLKMMLQHIFQLLLLEGEGNSRGSGKIGNIGDCREQNSPQGPARQHELVNNWLTARSYPHTRPIGLLPKTP